MPVLTAKMAPKALTRRTCKERKDGIVKPERRVFSSGIPLPDAMYIVLPVAGIVGVEVPSGLVAEGEELEVSEAVGREDLVNMVALEEMIPNARAMAT
jgi:hypothetical protein